MECYLRFKTSNFKQFGPSSGPGCKDLCGKEEIFRESLSFDSPGEA